jgi:hypothetical protein
MLLESGAHYALDLSHLHIVATASGYVEWGLLQELLASPKCLEVHLSGNDGSADQHNALDVDVCAVVVGVVGGCQSKCGVVFGGTASSRCFVNA